MTNAPGYWQVILNDLGQWRLNLGGSYSFLPRFADPLAAESSTLQTASRDRDYQRQKCASTSLSDDHGPCFSRRQDAAQIFHIPAGSHYADHRSVSARSRPSGPWRSAKNLPTETHFSNLPSRFPISGCYAGLAADTIFASPWASL